ncbi:MAG: type II toxin-antitoxin system RelE/ParE family toxin [Clostridia bacterium]|nr:type II toxin-antitoxin system RelE/ParE family toxin [Clostridia bacterium]
MEYHIQIADEFKEEMSEIYEYISFNLKEPEIADKLEYLVYKRIEDLYMFPRSFMKMYKSKKIKGDIHRLAIKNYIVLYTINKKEVFIIHIFNQRMNYLNYL